MGSKRAAAERDAMAARVQAGELTASQAYALDKSGAFRKGYFEPYQEIAAKSKLGVWRSAPKAELKNAMSYKPSAEVDSKVVQRAKAEGVDPYGYSGVVPTPSLNPSPSKSMGYSLTNANVDPIKRRQANLEILTREFNASNDPEKRKYLSDQIASTVDDLNKLTQGKDYTGSPDSRALDAEANQLRATIREFQGSPEVTDRAQARLDAILNYQAEPNVFPLQQQNAPAPAPLPAGTWFDEVWDKTPAATPEQMANRGNGSVTVGAQGNGVDDPKLQAGIIKDVDTNLGDRIEKVTKTVGNTDPTIAGSGQQIGGKPDTPWSGSIEPTGQAALPSPTIGSGSVGTTDAVAKAVAALGKNADPYSIAQTVKQTVIAYGGSTDAANNMAASVLAHKGMPISEAVRVASSVPNSVAGTTAGPPTGYGSPAPGVTSNGVTGVNGSVSNAGTVTADAITGMPGGSPPTPIAGAPPVTTGGSNLVNGGTGTVQTPVAPAVPPVAGTPPAGGVTPPGADPGWKFDPMTGLAIGVGAAGAAASVLTGNAMADAQIKAAQIQATEAEKARALQESQYNQFRHDTAPWRAAGEEALGYTQDAAGNWQVSPSGGLRTFDQDNPEFKVDPFKFETTGANADPSYNFRLSEGLKALQSSAAAKGMLRSGNTMQAITDYGQGAASQEYNNAFNRYQSNTTNDFNRFQAQRGDKRNALQSLAGNGQSAVTQVGNAGQNYANQAGQYGMTGANATANGMTGAANDRASGWMGGIQTGMNALGMAINYNNQRDMTNAFAKYYGS